MLLMARYRPFQSLNAENYNTFLLSLVVLAGIVLTWVLFSMLLSLLSGPGTILLSVGLAALVWFRSHKINAREMRIQSGRCADCGYDLHATPERCPECGRDATQDEPTWRRLQRLREAELKKLSGAPISPDASLSDPSVAAKNRQRLRAITPVHPPQ